MNNLDERVIFAITSISGRTEGIYQYTVSRYISGNTKEIIFVGNFYYNGSDSILRFDITDIITSDGFVIKEDDFEGEYCLNNKLANKYIVTAIWGTDDTSVSTARWIAKVSSYKNKTLTEHSNVFFNPDEYGKTNNWSIMMQGFRKTNTSSVLTPHYPIYSDEEMQSENDCPFALSFLVGTGVTGVSTTLIIDSYDSTNTIPATGNTFSYITSVTSAADYRDITPTSNGVLEIGREVIPERLGISVDEGSFHTFLFVRYPNGDEINGDFPYAFAYVNNSRDKNINDSTVNWNNILTSSLLYTNRETLSIGDFVYTYYNTSPDITRYDVTSTKTVSGYIVPGYVAAIFDVCPKRYYLFWQDRYGSFQCQAFNDYINYSEEYTNIEVQDYQNRRRKANIQIQSKWKLNSGWITEEQYPYYESIYTSQILILFDVERNTRYSVLVNGNYEEKTYRNQKKMININLELEENKKQNIIY